MRNDNNELYPPSKREAVATLVASGLTLVLLVALGYAVPDLLTALIY